MDRSSVPAEYFLGINFNQTAFRFTILMRSALISIMREEVSYVGKTGA